MRGSSRSVCVGRAEGEFDTAHPPCASQNAALILSAQNIIVSCVSLYFEYMTRSIFTECLLAIRIFAGMQARQYSVSTMLDLSRKDTGISSFSRQNYANRLTLSPQAHRAFGLSPLNEYVLRDNRQRLLAGRKGANRNSNRCVDETVQRADNCNQRLTRTRSLTQDTAY